MGSFSWAFRRMHALATISHQSERVRARSQVCLVCLLEWPPGELLKEDQRAESTNRKEKDATVAPCTLRASCALCGTEDGGLRPDYIKAYNTAYLATLWDKVWVDKVVSNWSQCVSLKWTLGQTWVEWTRCVCAAMELKWDFGLVCGGE